MVRVELKEMFVKLLLRFDGLAADRAFKGRIFLGVVLKFGAGGALRPNAKV